MCGPWFRVITKAVKDMSPHDGPLFYASTTPEQQNAWLSQFNAQHDQVVAGMAMPLPSDVIQHQESKSHKRVKHVDVRHAYTEPVSPISDWTWVESDFSMMDNSYSEEAFEFLLAFYGVLGFPTRGPLAKMWRKMCVVAGSAGPNSAYSRANGDTFLFTSGFLNASGRDDTAVNNYVINAWLMMTAVLRMANVGLDTPLEVVVKIAKLVRAAMVGDDLLAAVHKSLDATIIPAVAEEGGFQNKILYRSDVTHCVFLGMRLYPCAVFDGTYLRHRLLWGKQLGRCLYKLGWQREASLDTLAWAKGVAWAQLVANPHVPILKAYCVSVLQKTRNVKMKVPRDLSKYRLPEVREAYVSTNQTLDMIGDVYGISWEEIQEAERQLMGVPTLPAFLSSRIIDRLVRVDMA